MMLKLAIPVLRVSDSAAAEDFYCNRLGFRREFASRDLLAEAEAADRVALDLLERLVRDQPDAVAYRKQLAVAYTNLGLLYARERKHAEVEKADQKSLTLHEALLRDHPKVVDFRVDLGAP